MVQVQSNINPDETLSQSVIGSWKAMNPWGGSSGSASWYRIDFRTDGTFADTIFNAFNWFQSSDTLTIISSGNYSIQNQVVEYSNVSFSYKTVSGKPQSFIISKLPNFLSITGDSLEMTDVNVLTPVDSTTNQLIGSWKFIFWNYISSSISFNPTYSGRREVIHIFGKDSSYTQIWKYLDRSDYGQSWKGNYYYNPPLLRTNAGGAVDNIRVEFHSSKMYWFFGYSTLKVGRIK